MKTISTQLKAAARDHLSGRYSVLILACILANVIINIPSFLISYTVNPYSNLGTLIRVAVTIILAALSAVFTVGQNYICLCYARSRDRVPTSFMWYGFKDKADDTIKVYFRIFLKYFLFLLPLVLALALCMTMPGVITMLIFLAVLVFSTIMCIRVELNYSQVYFLVLERPNLSAKELLAASKRMMYGSRGRLLYIQISFIGMYLLNLLTFGVAKFWVTPYVRMTMTEFYLDLAKAPAYETEA